MQKDLVNLKCHVSWLMGKNPHPVSSVHLLSTTELQQRHARPGAAWGPAEKLTKVARRINKEAAASRACSAAVRYKRDCGDSVEKVQSISQGLLPSVPPAPFPCPPLGRTARARCWSLDLSFCTFSFCTVVIPNSFCSLIKVNSSYYVNTDKKLFRSENLYGQYTVQPGYKFLVFYVSQHHAVFPSSSVAGQVSLEFFLF